MVAIELHSGRTIRLWRDELKELKKCPMRLDERVLYVSYYSIAEMSCHLALGWEMPHNVLDLYTEFGCGTNGMELPNGKGLLGALAYHGLPGIDSAQKEAFRELTHSASNNKTPHEFETEFEQKN